MKALRGDSGGVEHMQLHLPPPAGLLRGPRTAWAQQGLDDSIHGPRDAVGPVTAKSHATGDFQEHVQTETRTMSRLSTSDEPVAAPPVAGPGSGVSTDPPSPACDVDSAGSNGWTLPTTYPMGFEEERRSDDGEEEAAPPPRGAAPPRTSTRLRPTPSRVQRDSDQSSRTASPDIPRAAQWRRLPIKGSPDAVSTPAILLAVDGQQNLAHVSDVPGTVLPGAELGTVGDNNSVLQK